MAEENTPRVYGMADQADKNPPPARDPEFAHMVTLESGKRVPVSQGNGVSYAEATGAVARPEQQDLQVEFVPEEQAKVARPPRRSTAPLLIGAVAAGAAAGVFLIERLRRSSTADHAPTNTASAKRDDDAGLALHHETGPLMPVQQLPLPHQQPILDEISPLAS